MADAQTAPSGAFENGEHVYPIRVYYDDSSAAGMDLARFVTPPATANRA